MTGRLLPSLNSSPRRTSYIFYDLLVLFHHALEGLPKHGFGEDGSDTDVDVVQTPVGQHLAGLVSCVREHLNWIFFFFFKLSYLPWILHGLA